MLKSSASNLLVHYLGFLILFCLLFHIYFINNESLRTSLFVKASPLISTNPPVFEPTPVSESKVEDIKATDFSIKNARYLIANNYTVRFDWSGIVFELKSLQILTLKEIVLSFFLKDNGNSYNIKIINLKTNDILKQTILQTSKKYGNNVKTMYNVKFTDFSLISNDIKSNSSFVSLVVEKRTEPYLGIVTFYGMSFNNTQVKYVPNHNNSTGSSFTTRKLLNPLKMEFLGASTTCGYGAVNTSQSGVDCNDGNVLQEDVTKSFVTLTPKYFKNVVEYRALCWAGIGVIRGNFSSIFTRTLAGDFKTQWNFGLYVPDVVVINLGNNDLSGTPETFENYRKSYNDLLNLIFNAYLPYNKNIKVISMAGVLAGDSYKGYTEKIVKERWEYGKNLFWFSMAGMISFDANNREQAGCYAHAGISTHQLMAESLINFTSTLIPPPEYEPVEATITKPIILESNNALGKFPRINCVLLLLLLVYLFYILYRQ
ncbi:hypothetical protein ABK040_002492 [Willaertia magna]